MEILDILKRYFVAPPAIDSFGQYVLAVLTLIVPWLLLVWLLAMLFRVIVKPIRESHGTQTGVKLAWAWASLSVAGILITDLIIVWILGRISSWSAATPHVSLVEIGVIIASLVWLGERVDLRQMQRILRRAEEGAKQ